MQRIAIPILNGTLSEFFGRCNHFEVFDVIDKEVKTKQIKESQVDDVKQLPNWASEQGITDIIAYKVEKQILNLFIKFKINLFVGIPIKESHLLIDDYLNGDLKSDNQIITGIMSDL